MALIAAATIGGDDDIVTEYGYNKLGWLTRQTDARGYATSYEYDNLGRRIKPHSAHGADGDRRL